MGGVMGIGFDLYTTLSKMKQVGRYRVCEGIDDFNICKWWYVHTVPMEWELKARYLTLTENELPENIDQKFQETKRIVLTSREVDAFFETADGNLRQFFPGEFDDDFNITNTVKSALKLQLALLTAEGWGDPKKQKALNEQMTILQDLRADQPGPIAMWKSFEGLCYALSQADGVSTVRYLKGLSVYEFYMHKTQAQEWLRRGVRPKEMADA